jgi:hypothetical protein
VCAASYAAAQETNLRECFGKEFPELLLLFERWNSKDLKLAKEEFKNDFIAEVRELAPQKPPGWERTLTARWESLNAQLETAIKLSNGAQVLLIGMYSENAAAFRQKYESAQAREYRLRMKLFIILSAAQEQALSVRSTEIQPSHLFRAMMSGFTGWFPLCPEK